MTATQTDRLTEDVPTEERIRQRAHEIYLQRGDGVGSELDDWLAQFRRLWSQHVDALERHLDRMDAPMDRARPTKSKTTKRQRGPNREHDNGETK